MKKVIFVGLVLGLASLVVAVFFLRKDKKNPVIRNINNEPSVTINVCNWGEFISDGSDGSIDVNKEFTKKTGIIVNYTTFQSNEALFAKLKNKSISYDIIVPSEYMVAKLIKNNMLRKIDYSYIPNFKLVDPSLKNPEYDPNNEYSVPYAWGIVSLIYNKKFVTEPAKDIDWDILWNKKYKNKILMFDNPRDAMAISLIKNGYSLNSTIEKELKVASDDLKIQKQLAQGYVMDQIFDKMINKEAFIAPYYLGDALTLREKNPNLGVVIPKSGTNKFLDAMCIPINAEHPREALEYINFLCTPEVSKANSEHIQYFSPIAGLNKIDEIENVENLDKIFEKGFTQTFTDLPENTNKLLKNIWVNLKTEGTNSLFEFSVVLITVLFLVLLVILKKRHRNKCD